MKQYLSRRLINAGCNEMVTLSFELPLAIELPLKILIEFKSENIYKLGRVCILGRIYKPDAPDYCAPCPFIMRPRLDITTQEAILRHLLICSISWRFSVSMVCCYRRAKALFLENYAFPKTS